MKKFPLTTMALTATLIACGALAQAPAKKLVEYGWDVPTTDAVAKNIREMEKRPFDGIIFRLKGGSNVLAPALADPAAYAEDLALLPAIAWEKFTDNFVIALAASDQDWFDDTQWTNIVANTKLVAKCAQLGRCKGICFDAEPYGTNPWSYQEAAHKDTISFADYSTKARQRGAQFMCAIESELPSPVILNFYLISLFSDYCRPMDEADRQNTLSEHSYALFPAFFEGMLEASSAGTRFVDGNEPAYYYTTEREYLRVRQVITERSRHFVPEVLWNDYHAKVQVGQALYLDQYFGLRTDPTLGNAMDPPDKARWCEHNAYMALDTTDQYVWCYSERMNWWTNTDVPEGCENALAEARRKVAAGEDLGVDLAPIVEAARQRQAGK